MTTNNEPGDACGSFREGLLSLIQARQPVGRTNLDRAVLSAAEADEQWAFYALRGGVSTNVATALAHLVYAGRITVSASGYEVPDVVTNA